MYVFLINVNIESSKLFFLDEKRSSHQCDNVKCLALLNVLESPLVCNLRIVVGNVLGFVDQFV